MTTSTRISRSTGYKWEALYLTYLQKCPVCRGKHNSLTHHYFNDFDSTLKETPPLVIPTPVTTQAKAKTNDIKVETSDFTPKFESPPKFTPYIKKENTPKKGPKTKYNVYNSKGKIVAEINKEVSSVLNDLNLNNKPFQIEREIKDMDDEEKILYYEGLYIKERDYEYQDVDK